MQEKNYHEFRVAFERAVGFLGDDVRETLFHYLENNYGIVISDEYCSPLSEIKFALSEIFGEGVCIIILQRLNSELGIEK